MSLSSEQVPPGLQIDHNTRYSLSSSSSAERSGGNKPWLPFTETRFYTNAFICIEDSGKRKLLLGFKKRGFGARKYNGFGGKVTPGESSLEAAKRELQEEAGILAPLVHVGVYLFLTEDIPWAFHIDIYRADSFEGQVTESDEMRPVWFSIPKTPGSLTKLVAGDDADGELTPSTVLESALPRTVTAPAAATEESLPKIPYDQMWEGDYLWLPNLLSERKFIGRADFTHATGQTVSQADDAPTETRLSKWWFATIDE